MKKLQLERVNVRAEEKEKALLQNVPNLQGPNPQPVQQISTCLQTSLRYHALLLQWLCMLYMFLLIPSVHIHNALLGFQGCTPGGRHQYPLMKADRQFALCTAPIPSSESRCSLSASFVHLWILICLYCIYNTRSNWTSSTICGEKVHEINTIVNSCPSCMSRY